MNLDFAGRLNKPELILKEFNYWVILLKEGASTLGHCVIILKSNKLTFSEITKEEMAEFPLICKWFEDKTKKIFGAEKWNYCAMMMKEEFVHFQALPRYSKVITKYDLEWIDKDWPKKPNFDKLDISEGILQRIKEDLLNDK